ncbi:MAG: HNH endonuclease [Bacilli bacterium]|nr:HNH endonuclease [Bacilli bacterium]
MQKGLQRKNIFPIKDIFKILKTCTKTNCDYAIIDGEKVHTNSQRYKLFMTYGCTCCKCGLKAEYFALEKYKDQNRYHLNLYGIKDGKEILFTKDHIIPKSKGGKSKLENYQTMCSICNQRKGCD